MPAGASRLLVQYLEPSPEVTTADPARLRDRWLHALDILPVTDLALGWDLRPAVVEAIRSAVPGDITVWRWVPVFTDSGAGRPVDSLIAVGPNGIVPPPFRDMADFRFLCPDHPEVVEAGLERAVALGREVDADGVLLDRIRWHSPGQSPSVELTCFCVRSREVAAADGLDLEGVAGEVQALADTLVGRRVLVAALLGRDDLPVVDDFLDWRAGTVTGAVERLSQGLREAGLATALDVFTPALARSVGQDLGALAGSGRWAKSMTYFDALGPASMPFELRGYSGWLEEAGESDARGFLAGVLGFDPPGLGVEGVQRQTLDQETGRLAEAMGAERSIVGVDTVEIPGVCEVDDDDLDARIAGVRAAGLGLSPCWELLFIGDERVKRIGAAWAGC